MVGGRGVGGSEPSLSVQTFCVHTCLMGGGSAEVWTMFFLMASLISVAVVTLNNKVSE